MDKVLGVACSADRVSGPADSRNLRIACRDRQARSFPCSEDFGVAGSRHGVESDDGPSVAIRPDRSLNLKSELLLPFAFRQPTESRQELGEGDCGDSDVICQRFQLCDNMSVGLRLENFGDDIGVENDHEKSTERAVSARSGTGSSSTPPTDCAACKSANPIFGRVAALVRISRTSASMELPCRFA